LKYAPFGPCSATSAVRPLAGAANLSHPARIARISSAGAADPWHKTGAARHLINEVIMLNKSFTAELVKSPKPGGWTYVVWPQSASFFGTRGLVKVKATVDGHPLQSSFMALGDGNHKLPVKAEILQEIGKRAGQKVRITLLERISAPGNKKKQG
jgi:hypothetical protein